DGGQAPRLESSSSLVGRDSPDDIFAVLVRWEISANEFTPRRYCLDCAKYRDELKVAEHLMTSTLEVFQRHCARPEDHGDILLSRKLSGAQFDAYKAYCALGDTAQDHALTHYKDYATPATAIRRPFRVQPPSKPAASTTPSHTRSAVPPVTRTTPGRTRLAAPPVTRTTPGRTRPAVPLEVITTPAPNLVAAASTDTTAAAHTQTTAPKANNTQVAPPQVAAPPAQSNNDGAADTAAPANSASTLPTSTMVDNALPANANSAGDSTLQENNTSTPPANSTVDNAASVHITGAAVKTSSASSTSEPPGNDSVGCSTPVKPKPKRATGNPSQQDIEEAFRKKEWRPSSFGRYPNSKRGRRRQLRRNASVFKNMARVPTQQRAHSTLRKRIAALVRRVSTNSSSVTGCLSGDKPTRGWLPGNKPPVTRAQTTAPLVDTTMSAPSLVAAASTASTAAHTQTAAPPATLTTPASSQVAMPLAAPPPPGPSQTATSNTDTTTAALTQTAAPQLAQRAIGMDVDAPAQNIVAELYPVGQGAIGVGIAHAAGQQQMPDAVDMDIEVPGQGLFIDNGPAVNNGMHVPAPQPVDNILGMDVDTTEERAVAEYYPAGQGAVVGDIVRAAVQEQVQGAPGMDVDVPPQHVDTNNGAGIGMGVDQGATTGGLAQAPAPQPANSTLGMDVDATEQNAVAELDRVGRDIIPPFADWVVARSARYATLRAYLRKMRQLDRAAPYDIPTREQRRRLRRKWAEANNAAAQQHSQSTLGASTAAPTQHAASDSETVVGENPAGQGAIEDDIAHAPPQQQMRPGIANPADLPRATDGDHNDDG
ncbi:hypothetical protein GGF41_004000, partial [Coemansia sp. RSA 2531]